MGPEVTNATPFPYILVCHQGHIEVILGDELASHGVSIDRPVGYVVHKEDGSSRYPLIAYLQNVSSGLLEEVHTKYILGCDGAGSSVRKGLHIESEIQQSTDSWAVADVYVETDFPDIRRRCALRTKTGSMMLIPGPNETIRLYTLLSSDEVSMLENSHLGRNGALKENEQTVVGILCKKAKETLQPYKIDIKAVEWVSMYHIAQRIVKDFSDRDNRIFILGDACHTHSPKAAQGMNTSMNDAYNLTWKLALQLKGLAKPGLLKTYHTECHHIGKQLIDFGHEFAALFASPDAEQGVSFHQLHVQSQGFTSGLGHQYPSGLIVEEKVDFNIDLKALEPVIPGKRLYSIALTKHLSGDRVNLLNAMSSNGRFHIVVFCGRQSARNIDLEK